MMMLVSKLHLMQSSFRLPQAKFKELCNFVANGGRFNLESIQPFDTSGKLIAIARFEDSELYVRDGFHRAMAIHVARPGKSLYQDEFVYEDRNYEDYLTANLNAGYCTPFDPRTEVRVPDFSQFKIHVYLGATNPEEYILNNKNLYCEKKQPWHESVESFWTHYCAKE